MSTYYFAFDNEKNYLFDNFPPELTNLVHEYTESSKIFNVTIDGINRQARLGRKYNNFGAVFTLTTEDKYISRPKLFKELLDTSILALKPLDDLKKSFVETKNRETEEFIHNVTSLNGYSIQDLFVLIPQDTLAENITKQSEIVKDIIQKKPNVTVSTLLKLIKYTLATKVEFSVYERTQSSNGYGTAQKMEWSIRAVVLSVLQIFMEDFEKMKVRVSLDAGADSEKRLKIDYDSLFVSLFYILDNSIKYCLHSTEYKIIFREESDGYAVMFNMASIKINDNEVPKLTEHGYRSAIARSMNKEGKGIGMYRIVKTLKLNDATLEIKPRINEYKNTYDGIEYECNQFKVIFKGQNSWLKTSGINHATIKGIEVPKK